MAAAITGQMGNPDQLLLRWSEDPASPLREQQVEMVRLHVTESVIRSALRISENTKVYIIGKDYTGSGIVRSCRQEGGHFLLTISVDSERSGPELLPERDPGLFAVDDFLTEEEEAKILENLNLDTLRRQRCLPADTGCVFRRFLFNLRLIVRATAPFADCLEDPG